MTLLGRFLSQTGKPLGRFGRILVRSMNFGHSGLTFFTAPKGGPLRRKEFSAGHWKPALEEAGIEHLRVHDLRHTCASLLIATGANPKAVQATGSLFDTGDL